MRRLTLLVAVLLAAVLLPGTANAAERHPVPYNFFPYALFGGVQTDAPGSNDWTCRPSSKHPRPVVLVHGLTGNKATNWQTYAPLLANEGYCVFALTYGARALPGNTVFGGLADIRDSAAELKTFVAKVRRATGASKVDLVGHSEGTLMPNYYVKFLGGDQFVKRYVSIAPLWHGTQAASPATIAGLVTGVDPGALVPVCVACAQFSPDSAFMRKMRRGGVAVPGVDYTNIVTRYDELVLPYTSGIEKGMRNHVLQELCATDYSEHFQIASSRTASVAVLNALDPQHRRPVPCDVVLPFVGGAPQP
jgi:triacylglycerol lipase